MAREEDEDMDANVNDRASARLEHGSRSKPKSTSSTHKALITRNLRLAYGEVASEPMPQRFLEILKALDGDEEKKS